MTTYSFEPDDYSLTRMQIAAESLGGGAAIVAPVREDGTPGVPYLAVSVPDGVTLTQIDDAYANARQKRDLIDIYFDLRDNLSTQNKNAIWTDISRGTPRKYFVGPGDNKASIVALDWSVSDSGATGTALTNARLRLVAMYVQDNPKYLVNPAFAPGVNVPGDTPAV